MKSYEFPVFIVNCEVSQSVALARGYSVESCGKFGKTLCSKLTPAMGSFLVKVEEACNHTKKDYIARSSYEFCKIF